MGYGTNLKKHLDDNKMSVSKLARKTGISATTLYSIISRDSAVRYDFAVRIANVLNIPISDICKENPYSDSTDVLPHIPDEFADKLDLGRVSRYVNDRIDMIFQLFGTSDLPTIEAALAKCYQVNDDGRSKILDYIKYIYDTSQDDERVKEYKDKVGTHL